MIHVCALADLPRGGARRLALTPPVSVFHTDDGELFAIDDTCTHQEASLADGWLEGCEIECPLHAAIFDLRTGEPDGMLAHEPVRTHRVVVEGDAVYVVLSGSDAVEAGRSAGGARMDTGRSAGGARMDTGRSAGGARMDTAS